MSNLLSELDAVVDGIASVHEAKGIEFKKLGVMADCYTFIRTHHAEIAAAVRDGERCWAIHLLGPDDVIAAPSKLAAEIVARNFNAYWDAHKHERSHDVHVVAEVIEWGFSPIEHAKSVIQSFDEYVDLLDDAALSAREGEG